MRIKNTIIFLFIINLPLFSSGNNFDSYQPDTFLPHDNIINSINYLRILPKDLYILKGPVKKICISGENSYNESWYFEYEFNIKGMLLSYSGFLDKYAGRNTYYDQYLYENNYLYKHIWQRGDNTITYLYLYNEDNQLIRYTDASKDIEFYYDDYGRIIGDSIYRKNELYSQGSYSYNLTGQLINYERINATTEKRLFLIEYKYENDVLVELIEWNTQNSISAKREYSYYSNGNLHRLLLFNGNEKDTEWIYSEENTIIEYISYPTGYSVGARWFGKNKYYYENGHLFKEEKYSFDDNGGETLLKVSYCFYCDNKNNVSNIIEKYVQGNIYIIENNLINYRIFFNTNFYREDIFSYDDYGNIISVITIDDNENTTSYEKISYTYY